MKILIFTHKNDIDGVGCAVLAKLAFAEVEYVLCETFDLNKELSKALDSERIYSFDKVFVTDLWPKDEVLERITSDEKLNEKFFIFDHHKSSLDSNFSQKPFATIKIGDENGLCCATSMFYNYLVDCKLISPKWKAIAEFVELTRRHDTWEWKTIYNDEKSRELSLLFDSVTPTRYINLMTQKFKLHSDFYFDAIERYMIATRIDQINEKIPEYLKNIQYKEILGLKAGILFIEYSYRNELGEYFRENNFDMDFAMFIAMDRKTASYRSVKDGVNVRNVAVHFGGKGHDSAATNPISDKKFKEFLLTLI